MCIPGLHLSLGIFNCLYTLLESACEDLDTKVAGSGVAAGGASFQKYSLALKQLREVEEKQSTDRQKMKVFMQLATYQ